MSIFMITGGRWRRALLALLLLLPAMAFADTPTEDSVKAGFILDFAKFTDWPAIVPGNDPLTDTQQALQ
jgi:hypothetical protein